MNILEQTATEPSFLFGRLTWKSVPWDDPIIMGVTAGIILIAIILVALLTVKKGWGTLFNDWLFSVDHKKLGIMYVILSVVMLVRGFVDALMMTSQQAMSASGAFGQGYLPPEHFDQVFTAHGVIMIFFVATPLFAGLANLVLPLQLGTRDVAFPFLNLVSFWLTLSSTILINLSLFIGSFAATGWLAYTPLSGLEYRPGVGVDYWIWALQISGIGTTLTVINFIATIAKNRAPGMTIWKIPTFSWTVLCCCIIALLIFPLFTATIAMLTLDRYADFKFFTAGYGGNAMMWVNLVWAWGHPEVYFLVLPAFGCISEVVATFSRKRLFGYVSLVWATIVIAFLSFLVWTHHFFTMGSGASVNAFFGIMTMIIAIPTGVKVYNWIFTMYRGKIVMSAAMWWVMVFLITFTIGGMTGVMLSIPTNDYMLHNSEFLVAHFHNTLIGGVVFGFFAGMTYWWPKATGYKLNECLGKWSAALWMIGFFVAWMPRYLLGFAGVTRRQFILPDPSAAIYLYISFFGALIILAAVLVMIYNFVHSYRHRFDADYADTTGDPWNGRTLEWATSSPPAEYNFAKIPTVNDRDAFQYMKANGTAFKRESDYQAIHMPTNAWQATPIGIGSLVMGFALVWHIWWLAIVGVIAILFGWLARAFSNNKDYYIPADEVMKIENRFHDSIDKAMNSEDFATRPLRARDINKV